MRLTFRPFSNTGVMLDFSFTLFLSVLLGLGLIWLAGRYFLKEDVVYIPDNCRRHAWKSVTLLSRACVCSVCDTSMSSNGHFCESCGVCSDNGCVRKADEKFPCKQLRIRTRADDGSTSRHLWVKGNLPLGAECSVCGEDIDQTSELGLFGQRCAWCQRMAHDKCFSEVSSTLCDFGPFKEMIFPPKCILASRSKVAPKVHLTGIIPPEWKAHWRPLIVVANSKSGSSGADQVVALMRGILHPLQVFELGQHGPHEALQWAIHAAPTRCRILVAGGDGTVGWVLNTILQMKVEPHPEVAILPMGTGNDLSRVLGWGAESPDEFDPIDYLTRIASAETVQLDRWLAAITTHSSLARFHVPGFNAARHFYVYNYLSVGVDALVTLNFHKARESSFYFYSSRFVNKLLYLCFGTQQVMQQDCVELEKNLELYLDGVRIELPQLQSVVVLNIDSWGAGVKLWEMSKNSPTHSIMKEIHSISDGILEVFGVVSSFHIAQLQVGLSKPVRLGQAKSVRIVLKRTLPMQADGEPWMQSPCDINIQHYGQATMLKNVKNYVL
uniref:Diacylglycerol kinase n=1 Tax=Anopheles atroparvus TaxID=41427 RepID=A0AAG5DBT8_ANOAO